MIKSAKERNKNLEELINPKLLELSNVTFQKFDRREFVRGLAEGERPFPVTPRIAPYEIKNQT